MQDMRKDPLRFFRRVRLGPGEMARVSQITRGNGTSIILPYDQFIEHDCRHLEAESDAGNPDYIMELGIDLGFNAVAVHYGVARRFWTKTEGRIPLILKVNGKTSIPSDAQALSTATSFVEDAVRIGATGIGYTLYYGSPRQDEDLPQMAGVRAACERFGLPLIVWAYPRGEAIDAKGGKETSYALESAARLAVEMGATIVKSNLPKAAKPDFVKNEKVPKYYRELEEQLLRLDPAAQAAERARRVVKAATGIPVLFSGGEGASTETVIENAKACVAGGCFGFIIGRNMWKRTKPKAQEIVTEVTRLLDAV
ncbi:MAG: fructose-bisphosphate aldolase [Deltaproteobacteria bacterium]|nr:fructose-bisphosphate aldolase [Deltaproteobacteria bacterium]